AATANGRRRPGPRHRTVHGGSNGRSNGRRLRPSLEPLTLIAFDLRLSTGDFRLPTFDFRLPTFDFRLKWGASAAQRTLGVPLRPPKAAGVHHAQMAQREVELDRIEQIEPPQRRRNVARHPSPRTRV